MALRNKKMDGAADIGRRGSRAGVAQQHAVVAEKGRVLQGGKDAAVGVDTGEQQAGDALAAQDAVQLVIPKAAQAVFADLNIGGSSLITSAPQLPCTSAGPWSIGECSP